METMSRTSVLFIASFLLVVFSSTVAEGKFIRIDTHAHFVPQFYYDLFTSHGVAPGGLPIPKWNVADHLALMDSLNIELSILSVSTPGARFTPFDVEDGRKLARQLNEYGHMLTMAHPERFQFFATLTLPDVEGAVEEAIFALDTLKAAGVTLLASSHGEYLGSKKFDPLMEVLDAREATVFVHPSSIDVVPLTNDVGGKEFQVPAYMMDFLFDTTRAAANLVMMNVTGRYPNIKFLLAHSGGFLPFAAYRMSGAMGWFMGATFETVLAEFQKFYVDTALSSSPSALPSTLQFIPSNQITFGTDYPYAPTPAIRIVSKSFDEYLLEDDKRHHINYESAHSLFQKQLSHWRGVWHKGADTELFAGEVSRESRPQDEL